MCENYKITESQNTDQRKLRRGSEKWRVEWRSPRKIQWRRQVGDHLPVEGWESSSAMATSASLMSSIDSVASAGSAGLATAAITKAANGGSNDSTISASGGSRRNSSGRQRRYARSTTVSVAQLLHDSCNSILQRFRRNPSEKPSTAAATAATATLGTPSSSSSEKQRPQKRSSTNLR